jgi:hypothetical protein
MASPPRRRIVVPTARQPRRVVKKRQTNKPEWMSGALVDAAILIGTTLATTLLLLLISGQLHDTTAGTLIARSAAPALPLATAQPTPEQSSISHPLSSPQFSSSPASPRPTASTEENEATANLSDDSTIQATIDSKLQDNADLSSFGLTVTISGGAVTMVGTVPSDEVKTKIEKLVRAVKGVKHIDNQIVVVTGA